MKNLLYIHAGDSRQWDFLFLTEGKIFTQKEFFIRYSRIYLEYSLKKISDSIRTLDDSICIPGKFQKIEMPNIQDVLGAYLPESEILLITGENMPDFGNIPVHNSEAHQIDESNFLAQVEPEWKNLNKIIKENSDKIIFLYLGISRFNIAKRLMDYKRDFVDISYLDAKKPLAKENTVNKKIKKILLALHLYALAVKIYHILGKILRKK